MMDNDLECLYEQACLDLSHMLLRQPGTDQYTYMNILATLQDGDLDILMQDDSKIDFLTFTVIGCCDTCYATGDVDGNGIPLTSSDLAELIAFVTDLIRMINFN